MPTTLHTCSLKFHRIFDDQQQAPNSEEAANMVSLVIFGEYDNMSHLVRDGAKKLRDNSEHSDERLLSVNLQRPQEVSRTRMLGGKLLSPSRKRVSPHTVSTPSKPRYFSNSLSNLPQSAPPKLKGHPRDRPSSRRGDGFRRFPDNACSGMFSPQYSDSDWSGGMGFSRGFNSFLNCGAADQAVVATPKDKGMSPHQMQQEQPQMNDYRNETNFAYRSYNQGRTDAHSQHRVAAPGRDPAGTSFHV